MSRKLLTFEPWDATEIDIRTPWYGHPKNFRCGFCGHKFVVGDEVRSLYTNDTRATGNPLACSSCVNQHNGDKEALRQAWIRLHEEFHAAREGKFWWFYRREGDA